jgi:hypothetical protein
MNVHNLPPESRRRPFEIDQILHILQFSRSLGRGTAGGSVKRGEGIVNEGADFVGGSVVADYFEEIEGFGFVRLTDEFEDIV